MRNTILQRRARTLRNGATDTERHLWQRLRRRQVAGCRFRRQVPIAGYIVDFACLESRIAIELDGGQHGEQLIYDRRRDRAIEARGFKVLRFWDHEVLREIEAVLQAIWDAVNRDAPTLTLPRARGREWEGGSYPSSRAQGRIP